MKKDKMEETIIAALFFVALAVVVAQGIIKYINPGWSKVTEDISQYIYCYMAFFGIGYCVKYGRDLSIKLFPKLVDGKLKGIFTKMYDVVYLVVYGALLVGAVQGIGASIGQYSKAAHLPVVLTYISALIGFALGLFRLGQKVFGKKE